MELEGRVWVITGASSGIGRRTASDVAARGAVVCAVARREDRLERLLGSLPGDGHSCSVTDVSRRDQVEALAQHVDEVHGRCDVLVNNAGFSKEGPVDAPGSLDALSEVMGTNFFGAAYCTAELLGLLKRSAPSNVVNVASMAGRLAMGGASAYCASKFALVGYSESLHYELRPQGITVSCIEPGPLPTEGFAQSTMSADPLLRHVLTTEADVSRAIQDVVATKKAERVVPRWYYLLQVPRLLAPPLYRFAQGRFVQIRAQRELHRR